MTDLTAGVLDRIAQSLSNGPNDYLQAVLIRDFTQVCAAYNLDPAVEAAHRGLQLMSPKVSLIGSRGVG
jgi:hypothetical protein